MFRKKKTICEGRKKKGGSEGINFSSVNYKREGTETGLTKGSLSGEKYSVWPKEIESFC